MTSSNRKNGVRLLNTYEKSSFPPLKTLYQRICKTAFAQRNCGTGSWNQCCSFHDRTRSCRIRIGSRCGSRDDGNRFRSPRCRSNSGFCDEKICHWCACRKSFVCELRRRKEYGCRTDDRKIGGCSGIYREVFNQRYFSRLVIITSFTFKLECIYP